MFVRKDTLAMLTGYTRPSFQKRWLDKLGLCYITNSKGEILVAEKELERILTNDTDKNTANNFEVNLHGLQTRIAAASYAKR